MKKKFNLLICFIIFLFLFEIFDHSNIIINTIYESSKIWFYNIVPTILPIYIIVDLLINYNAIFYLSKVFGSIMEKLFKLKPETSFVFLLSIISGFPSNSKYLKNMLDDKIINPNEANKLLLFTHFSNPLFIIESIGVSFLNNKQVGIIILVVHYLTNIIIGLFNRNYYVNLSNDVKIKEKKKDSFVNTLSNSIFNTVKILFLLYGIITFFMIVTSLIKANLPFNNIINSLLCGLLEMTQGIYFVSSLTIPLIIKSTIITFFISFGGLSIHMQVFSILGGYKLSYKDYFLARLMHAVIASSIVFLILYFMIPRI